MGSVLGASRSIVLVCVLATSTAPSALAFDDEENVAIVSNRIIALCAKRAAPETTKYIECEKQNAAAFLQSMRIYMSVAAMKRAGHAVDKLKGALHGCVHMWSSAEYTDYYNMNTCQMQVLSAAGTK